MIQLKIGAIEWCVISRAFFGSSSPPITSGVYVTIKRIKRAAQAVAKSRREKRRSKRIKRSDLLSTGSTLLNLACSGNPYGGFLCGKYYLLVGDSTSGKTFLSMSCFAEACRSRRFHKYRLVYDNAEDGMLLDVAGLFGKTTAVRVEPPARDEDNNPIYSRTVEDFYYHVDDAVQDGSPFVYVLDSMDALYSEEDSTKFQQQKAAHKQGRETTGSYGTAKAKANSAGIRRILSGLSKTGSILIVVSQTRDNLGFGFERKTRSGGKALRFYSTVEIWSSVSGVVKKTIRGKARKIGTKIKLQIKKNRTTGKLHEVETLIYPSYGIDDIGSCIDYLTAEGQWKKTKKTIKAEGLGISGTRESLIETIEREGLVRQLQSVVGDCWREIEEAGELNRKKRYQ